MPTPPLVRFHNVSKSFDAAQPVVRDLSLDVRRGEFLTLLGPSGSGKTTVLMMLAGFEQPDRGEILLDGRPVIGVAPHRRGIGLMSRNFALFPHLSVAENIGFPLAVRGIGRARREAQVERALDMVQLAGMGQRRPTQLSDGQRQRVALARALVLEPPLVLMDEPLGALDRSLREEMQSEIRLLHARLGVTVIYVTRDQAEAMTMSDRIAVLACGSIQQLGTSRTLYEAPANAFVARFIGENNQLPGRVASIDDDIATIRLDCGPIIEAELGDIGGVGEMCVVSIRPERIAVAVTDAATMGEGAIAARVVEAVFMGDHLRLGLSVAGGKVTVKRPAGAPSAGLVADAAVAIAWQPHHARAFRPESQR